MKSILIVGLGRFGRYMAQYLYERGNEVMAIDSVEEKVNMVLPFVTNAQIGDATNEQFIAQLGVGNFDLCVVAIENNFQSSLEATSLLKDYGARFVLARAGRDVHAKFLLRNGADEIVYTEKEMAERMAVKYGSDNIFDYIQLDDEYSIYEISVPESWVGRTIAQKNIRAKYNINILATKEDDVMYPNPGPDHVFLEEERLVIMGHNRDIEKLV
ncbi:MAG: TrkA family potassium uptake protein [Ruminococcaceae bacterium]|nr:TrkA family potassium uptake protein [Oscillospiraceae bacterium]